MGNNMKKKMPKGLKTVLMVLGGIIVAVGFAILFGIFVKLLWNWLMPMLFNLPEITYWQAVGIVILARLLFGTGHGHGKDNDKDECDGKPWKEIGREIKAEFRKEFEKEGWNEDDFPGKHFNEEDWHRFRDYWNAEGKERFEEFKQDYEEEKPEPEKRDSEQL